MHRDQSFGAEFLEGFHRLFWVHVNFAASGRLVSANWKQCDVDLVAFADFFESREISGVAAVKNRATVRRDDKSAKIAVQIRKEPGACAGRDDRSERELRVRNLSRADDEFRSLVASIA